MREDDVKWDAVDATIAQSQGNIDFTTLGEVSIVVSEMWRITAESEPVIPLNVYHPGVDTEDDDETENTATVNLSLPADTARELGEWLVEHADDEPETFLGGDGDG